jgi:hypothetical protein
MKHVRFALLCAFSKPHPLENYVIPGLSDIPKFMTGWVLSRFSAVRTRLGPRRDLLLELIVLRHQLARHAANRHTAPMLPPE